VPFHILGFLSRTFGAVLFDEYPRGGIHIIYDIPFWVSLTKLLLIFALPGVAHGSKLIY
jgi:hypothetical protein